MHRSGESFAWPLETLPRIHHAGRYAFGPDQWATPFVMQLVSLHLHENKGAWTMDGHPFAVVPGDVTITPAGTSFTHRAPRAGTHLTIHFHAPRMKGATVAVPLHLCLGPAAFAVQEKLQHIITMLRLVGRPETQQLADRVASTALQELMLWLALQHREKRTSSLKWRNQKRLAELAQRIDAGLGGVLSVPALADEVGLSQDYLACLFRKHYGVTIPGYILRRRVDAARHLLLTTREPIGAIATRVGLPDPQYFNKQFRRFVGMSPTDFRA